MRDIKYRVWEPCNKKMHYPDFTLYEFNKGSNSHKFVLPTGRQDFQNPYTMMNLNKVEIMQFTGLKDKEGKDIYEGDIVRIIGEQELDYGFNLDWDDKAIVKWSESECGYYLDIINKHERNFGDDFVATKDTFVLRKWEEEEWWIEYEVVGNVFEDQ